MISRIAIGWEEIEPVILANMAIRAPFVLLGPHGTNKTTAVREVSRVFGEEGFRFYDCTKEDLLSLAGIPDITKFKEGKFEYAIHDRTIWEAKVVVLDELSRANRETQNLFLEIILDRKLQGKPLKWELLIATMNPTTYKGTFKLDAALWDRFHAAIPVPDFQRGASAELFGKILSLKQRRGPPSLRNHITGNGTPSRFSQEDLAELKETLERIRSRFEEFYQNNDICSGVREYCSHLKELIHCKVDTYISTRRLEQLFDQILAIAAALNGDFEQAAKKAIVYSLAVPLHIDAKILYGLHNTLQSFVQNLASPLEKLRVEYAKCTDNDRKISFLELKRNSAVELFPFDELDAILMEIASGKEDKLENKHLWRLHSLLKEIPGHEEVKRVATALVYLRADITQRNLILEASRKWIYFQKDRDIINALEEGVSRSRASPVPEDTLRDFLLEERRYEESD